MFVVAVVVFAVRIASAHAKPQKPLPVVTETAVIVLALVRVLALRPALVHTQPLTVLLLDAMLVAAAAVVLM